MKITNRLKTFVKLNLRGYVASIYMALMGLFLCYLFLSGRNVYYISSSYFVFNFLMGLILLLFGFYSIFLVGRVKLRIDFISLFLLGGMIFLMTLPPKALSSVTANARSLNADLNVQEREISPLLQIDSSSLSISDWVKLKNYEADLSKFEGQEVNVVGFIFKYQDSDYMYNQNNFLVGRFIITCCAVDATPIGLEVDIHSLLDNSIESTSLSEEEISNILDMNNIKIDDWVSISGRWELKVREGEQFLVLEVGEIELVDQPSNPYE